MRIAALIPTRNNRPELLQNCLRMLGNQKVKVDHIELVNDELLSDKCDITWRYRIGYDRLRNKGIDLIFFIEDDDFYATDYIEIMLKEWHKHGKPNIFGTNNTVYYHIGIFAYFTMHHLTRSSAMSTIIVPDMNIEWCPDHEPYTDLHLWNKIKGVTFTPEKNICLGIKHGTTMTGGRSHVDRLYRYEAPLGISDKNKDFLRSNIDAESFEFYSNFMKNYGTK